MSKIIKRGDHYFWPRIERFGECVTAFCREGPNAGKPGPCPDPEKAKKRAEIKAGKINVKKVKEKVEKVEKEVAKEPELPAKIENPTFQPSPESQPTPEQEKARDFINSDPMGGVAVVRIDEAIQKAKEGTITSSDLKKVVQDRVRTLRPEIIDRISVLYGTEIDPMVRGPWPRANVIAEHVADKFRPEKEKWKPDNPPAAPFNPDSLIRKSNSTIQPMVGLLQETGQFTDGRILVDAPKWQTRKITQSSIAANPPDRASLDRFTKSVGQLRADAKRDAMSATASVASRRISDSGMTQYSLSDGQRAEAIDGRYHETITRLHPNAKPRLNKKGGGPISYFDGNRQVAILMPLSEQSPPIKHSESPSRRFSLQRHLFAKVA
jgi:hypothetical protein